MSRLVVHGRRHSAVLGPVGATMYALGVLAVAPFVVAFTLGWRIARAIYEARRQARLAPPPAAAPALSESERLR